MKNQKWKHPVSLNIAGALILSGIISCQNRDKYYTVADFNKVPKIDVHFHYNTPDIRYLKFADSLNFRLISPNVDTEMSIDEQLKITSSVKRQFPTGKRFVAL
jgi:vacuolar-type H+-ATPase subunit B/Vma2